MYLYVSAYIIELLVLEGTSEEHPVQPPHQGSQINNLTRKGKVRDRKTPCLQSRGVQEEPGSEKHSQDGRNLEDD